MFLVYVEKNNIYVAFQDLTDESRDLSSFISRALNEKNVPPSLHNRIKTFFQNNTKLSNNFERQKEYVSSLKTYIDIVNNKQDKTVYYLNLYILPKDIKIHNAQDDLNSIKKIEHLSLKIFQLYNEHIEKKDIEFKALKEFKGKSFLELELSFYDNQLHRLHDYLLNYKRSLKDKIICSDKTVGISLEDLNRLESNPLKQYQFVKVAHQDDLIIFIYSLMVFLHKERIDNFKLEPLYQKLKAITSKIYNFLQKIATGRNLKYEAIRPKELRHFFARYKNSPEIQKNKLLYDILENIFSNQLKEGVFLSKTIDMTKMFESVVEQRLRKQYGKRLFIGDENGKRIKGIAPYIKKLNKINYLLELPKIQQYPDYLIRSGSKYHVLDAKYKLKESLTKSREIFWQILIYARLFNKTYTNDLNQMKRIKKTILYADKFKFDFKSDDVEKLAFNDDIVNIFKPTFTYQENIFDSTITLIGIKIFKIA